MKHSKRTCSGHTRVTVSTTWTRFIEDVGGGRTITYRNLDFGSRLTWTIGLIFNTSPMRAVGVTVSISPLRTLFDCRGPDS